MSKIFWPYQAVAQEGKQTLTNIMAYSHDAFTLDRD